MALLSLVGWMAAACAPVISPIPPPPYRDRIAAPYDKTWAALVRALAFDNVPLRVVAKDSGVIASDDIVSPIGVYADCGRKGETPLEGEAAAAYTVYVRADGASTEIQINSKMYLVRQGVKGLECVSTTRWEPNLVDAVRRYVKE